jgi:hypothetical protein
VLKEIHASTFNVMAKYRKLNNFGCKNISEKSTHEENDKAL